MKRSIKISTQLLVGSAVIFLCVVALGFVTFLQTNDLYQQERILYEHPLQVREAVDEIKVDILNARVATRDFILIADGTERQQNIDAIQYALNDAQAQFDILKNLYLGPAEDIDTAYDALLSWKAATENRIDLAQEGKDEDIVASLGDEGDVGKYRVQLMSAVEVIDSFAANKATELNTAFTAQYRSLSGKNLALILTILALSAFISLHLIREIRTPLNELNGKIKRFHQGDLDARCQYAKNNEFGMLSASFNSMADAIQLDLDVSERVARLSDGMLSHDDMKMFFRSLLTGLTEHLNANTAAVYLLSKDKKTYTCFDSIGLSGRAREAFGASTLEGEFGSVLATHKVQRIREIPEDTRFSFPVSCGAFAPREIITIPVVSGREVIAVLSLSTIDRFYRYTDKLLEDIADTMNARVEGVLASQTIMDMVEKLEQQNHELDMQKSELSTQAAELMQQNTELDMLKSQLAEASRLKTNFLSNMSHELRTPLNSIIALSGVLNRRLAGQIPEEEHGYIGIVERNGKHLLELINDILDISRIEAGREEVEITQFNLGGIITDLTVMLEPLAVQKGVALRFDAGDAPLTVESDEAKCRHILQNILGNAVKFTEKGSVDVTAKVRGESLHITVRDTGIGIDRKYLANIFNEFSQADTTTTRKFGGTGLGLAIAKKYADLLGGTITVESTVGEGSTFTVVLPLRSRKNGQAPAAQEAAGPDLPHASTHAEAARTQGNGEAILLIEDSEPAIIQIKDLMETSGYRILVAHSAREAYKLIEDKLPDAMILDLMMPDVDGFSVLNTLRATEKTADIPVTILTAKHITHEELKDLKRNNVYQVIQKGGIDREKLLTVVADMLHPEPPQAAPAVRPAPRPKPAQGKPKILVVEDNPDNMTTLKALLEDKYELLEAADGETGVRLAREQMPGLILMDIALPGISGIDAFHSIRDGSATQHIPIVALTASVMTQERSTIMSHGFDAFVAKPLIAEELFKVIREALYD